MRGVTYACLSLLQLGGEALRLLDILDLGHVKAGLLDPLGDSRRPFVLLDLLLRLHVLRSAEALKPQLAELLVDNRLHVGLDLVAEPHHLGLGLGGDSLDLGVDLVDLIVHPGDGRRRLSQCGHLLRVLRHTLQLGHRDTPLFGEARQVLDLLLALSVGDVLLHRAGDCASSAAEAEACEEGHGQLLAFRHTDQFGNLKDILLGAALLQLLVDLGVGQDEGANLLADLHRTFLNAGLGGLLQGTLGHALPCDPGHLARSNCLQDLRAGEGVQHAKPADKGSAAHLLVGEYHVLAVGLNVVRRDFGRVLPELLGNLPGDDVVASLIVHPEGAVGSA